MPLRSGDKLGRYEILAPIGEGGMGEVYRATDPRMGRDVAIKICAERFSDRFSREVHAVAALNHPNICHLYDVGPDYLVMELVEGPTLGERIKQGAVPLEEALGIAKQIADALEAAHEKGITHRDLKPANVMVTPEGVVKVLDLGLAAVALGSKPDSGDPLNSPTLTMRATQAGMIMGTAAYMSPEQASGKPVDKRADIWSFGVVLWEMLTRHRLFDGETISHTLAHVLTGTVDFDKLPKDTPRRIRDLVRGCLNRDIKMRTRDIGDVRIGLQECLSSPTGDTVTSAFIPPNDLDGRHGGSSVGRGCGGLRLVESRAHGRAALDAARRRYGIGIFRRIRNHFSRWCKVGLHIQKTPVYPSARGAHGHRIAVVS
jgi:eukaryotic-like serine/threonine-protein kinase